MSQTWRMQMVFEMRFHGRLGIYAVQVSLVSGERCANPRHDLKIAHIAFGDTSMTGSIIIL